MALSRSYNCLVDSRKRISIGKLASQLDWSEKTVLTQTIIKRKGKRVIILEKAE